MNLHQKNPEYINFLQQQISAAYGIEDGAITSAKRGFYGETWKCSTKTRDYFIKIDYWSYHQKSYQNSLIAMDFMREQGISFLPEIIKTKNGERFFKIGAGIGAVFDYIEGENREDYPTGQLFERLAQVYRLDGRDLPLEREDFGTQVLEEWHGLIQQEGLWPEMLDVIEEHREQLELYEERLKRLGEICRKEEGGFYITHGDAGGNCILTEKDFYIIDWDTVKIAPIERDAWFFIIDARAFEVIRRIIEKNLPGEKLNPARLCYYCYYSYFHYLTEYVNAFLFLEEDQRKKQLAKDFADYFKEGWIRYQIRKAEALWPDN